MGVVEIGSASTEAAGQPTALAAALTEITLAIATSPDVSRTFSTVAQQTGRILSYDVMAVLLLDTGAERKLVTALCHPPTIECACAYPLTDFSFGTALLVGEPVIVGDFAATATDNAGDQVMLDKFGRAAVIVPIQKAPRVLGGLALISRTPGIYHAVDVPLVEPIATLLALALERQRLDQQSMALAVAEERNRLAREIHDTLAQSLTGIILNLESLKPYDKAHSQTEAVMLAETEALARRALEEARRSILGLHPIPLEHQSLRAALTAELAELAKRAGLTTQFYTQGEERPLAPDVATALFRVAQEAFQNIHKHAAAHHVSVGLAFESAAVILTVEDDGVGFDPSATPNDADSFGLISMAARTRSLDGELLINSHPGHGTIVRAALPYVRPAVVTAAVVLKGVQAAMPSSDAHPIRVLVVDDHPIARQGIRSILAGQPDVQVVGEAEDGLTAVAETSRLHPDVVLLDLQLPQLSGVEVLPKLRDVHPAVEVVILTVFDQDEQVFASLKAGARGYVLKDAPSQTIVEAVRAASHGQSSLPPKVATRVVERFAVLASQEVDPNALTVRELEVLGYMAKGTPYKEIATLMNITVNTAQYHAKNIMQKLDVRNRSEAVEMATQRGLLGRIK